MTVTEIGSDGARVAVRRGTSWLRELGGRARAFLIGLGIFLAAAGANVFAQAGTGQVTMFTITSPDPMQTSMMPLRTSRDFFPIMFQHNGNSGSYFVNTMGADIEGSTFDGGPGLTQNTVAAGFDTDGVKSINLVLFQTRFNITFQTTNAVSIQFDSTAPTFAVQRFDRSGGGGGGMMGSNTSEPFSSGQTIFTSNASLGLSGTVNDPDNGSPSDEITFRASVDGTESTFMGGMMNSGTFDGSVDLGAEDGEKIINLTAEDAFPMDAQSIPNRSQSFQIRVVLDTAPAQIESVIIVRNPMQPERRVEEPAGSTTFVGRDAVNIRVTFSEPLRMQPDLTITQMDGAPIRATPQQAMAIDNRIFVWTYTPVPQDAQNGPAQLDITNILDRAGNATDGDPLQSLMPGFVVDTIEPTRIRFPMGTAGDVVSEPADGARVGRAGFPRTIRVFVEDYDTRDTTLDTTVNASGVLFDTIVRAEPGASMNPDALTIRLLAPGGMEVPGSPSIGPPNGIFFNLPDFTDPSLMLPGFADMDGDGIAEPIEGTWQIEVGLVDRVGNTGVETFLFTVDTTPIRAGDLVVRITNPDSMPNPLMPDTVACLGGPMLQDPSASPTIAVTSTDPSFSVTRSELQWLSRIGGPNSTPVRFDSDPAMRDPDMRSISITNLREPGENAASDDFPVPFAQPGMFLPEGELDPRLGAADGIYLVRVVPVDDAGNRGALVNGQRRDQVDFRVNLDTVTPFTRRTFPADGTAINEPLRFVDSIIIDPESPNNGNEGCGVDVNASNLQWFLQTAYRPDDVDMSLLEASTMRLRTVLRFIHMPNNTDPTMPSFNPNDDAFRVLLELVDQQGFVRSLPTDGSMDGIYRINSVPVDLAGNTLGMGDGRRGTYFGLQADPSNQTTIDITDFFFLYDTVDPELTVVNLPDGAFLGGPSFTLQGETIDLSAQAQPDMGGSGIDRVEVSIQLVDQNGNPVQSVPEMQSPTNPSIFFPARRNPVVRPTRATLSPLRNSDVSMSPIRTTSTPYDDAFATSQRERRTWTVTAALPARDELLRPRAGMPGDHYRLRIRSFDRAGNVAEITRRVVVSLDHLRAPQPRAPVCGAFVNRTATTFEWVPVAGAASYTFELTDPTGQVFTTRVPNPMTIQTLVRQGEYRWRVASMDSAGNLGSFSPPCAVTLDRNDPAILSVTHMDPVEPNRNNGIINTGDVIFTIRFTEAVDTTRPIAVTLDPQGAVGVGPQPLTTTSFQGDTWVGRVNIPKNADPARWDGLATLQVDGVTDFAGNRLLRDRSKTVEIDTGPFYQTRFFISPFNDREITVSILASEALVDPPSLSNIQGVDLIDFDGTGPRPRANPVPNQPRQSFLTMQLSSQTVNQPTVRFDLTGQDLDLNDSRRTIEFQVIRPTRESADGTGRAASTITARGMAIKVAPGSSSGAMVYVFPPLVEGGSSDELGAVSLALSSEQGATTVQDELQDLGFTETIQSSGNLTGRISVALRAPEPVPGDEYPCEQVGLYQLVKGTWTWIGGCGEDGNVSGTLAAYGPMKLARDAVAPVAEAITPEFVLDGAVPGSTVTWRVADGGAGIDPASVEVLVDGEPMRFKVDQATGEVTAEVPVGLAPGTHQIQLAVTDRAGNAAVTAPLAMTAAGAFGFSDPPVAVPNPARRRTAIRFDLTRPMSTDAVTCEIYDVTGRRVRTLRFTGALAARDNRIDWDLRDSRGRAVANGVYLFRIRAKGAGGSAGHRGKIAVLR